MTYRFLEGYPEGMFEVSEETDDLPYLQGCFMELAYSLLDMEEDEKKDVKRLLINNFNVCLKKKESDIESYSKSKLKEGRDALWDLCKEKGFIPKWSRAANTLLSIWL